MKSDVGIQEAGSQSDGMALACSSMPIVGQSSKRWL